MSNSRLALRYELRWCIIYAVMRQHEQDYRDSNPLEARECSCNNRRDHQLPPIIINHQHAAFSWANFVMPPGENTSIGVNRSSLYCFWAKKSAPLGVNPSPHSCEFYQSSENSRERTSGFQRIFARTISWAKNGLISWRKRVILCIYKG